MLHVILTLEQGGAQIVVRDLCEQLGAKGHSSVVCTFEDGPVRASLEALGVPVEVLGERRHGIEKLPWFLSEMMSIRRRLADLIHKHRIDVVQTHLLQTLDFLTLALFRGTGLRGLVWTIHNVEFLPDGDRGWSALKRSAHRSLYRRTARKVDRIVAVSKEVRDAVLQQLAPVDEACVTTIPNGVDPTRYDVQSDRAALCAELGVEIASPLILAVGRLSEQKGHRYLLEAAHSVLRAHPGAHFLLAGDGELREPLLEAAHASGLGERVHFLGVRRDVPSLLASTDVFVLPSLWEGLPIAILEAMAAARPIVATDVGGNTEALQDGVTGSIVPPADAPALATAVQAALSDPDRARELGQSARERVVADFSVENQAKQYIDLFEDIVRSRGGNRR